MKSSNRSKATAPRADHRNKFERSSSGSGPRGRESGRVNRLSVPQLHFEGLLGLSMCSSLVLGLWPMASNRQALDLVASVVAFTFVSLVAWRIRDLFQGHRTQFFDWDRKPQAHAKTNFVAFGEEWPDRSVENAELRLMDRLHVGTLPGLGRLVVGLLLGVGLVALFSWWPIAVKVYAVLVFWVIFRNFFLQQSLWLLMVSGAFAIYFVPRDLSSNAALSLGVLSLVLHATSLAAFSHLKLARWRDLQLTTDLDPQLGRIFRSGLKFAVVFSLLFWSVYEVESKLRQILEGRPKSASAHPPAWSKRLAQSMAEKLIPQPSHLGPHQVGQAAPDANSVMRPSGSGETNADRNQLQISQISQISGNASPSGLGSRRDSSASLEAGSRFAQGRASSSGPAGNGGARPPMSAADLEQLRRSIEAIEMLRAHAQKLPATRSGSQDLQVPQGGSVAELWSSGRGSAEMDRELSQLQKLAAQNGLSPEEFEKIQRQARAQAQAKAQSASHQQWPNSSEPDISAASSQSPTPSRPADLHRAQEQIRQLEKLSEQMRSELAQTRTQLRPLAPQSVVPNQNQNSGQSLAPASASPGQGGAPATDLPGPDSKASRGDVVDPNGAARRAAQGEKILEATAPATSPPIAQALNDARTKAKEREKAEAEHKRKVEVAQKTFELIIQVFMAIFKIALIVGGIYLVMRVLRHFRKRGHKPAVRLIQLGRKERELLRSRLMGLRRQQLRPDQEVIETYNLLLGAFDASATPRSESEPAELFAERIAQESETFSSIVSPFRQSTRTFSRTLFGEIEVPEAELNRFRDNAARVFRFFEILDGPKSTSEGRDSQVTPV